MLNLVHQVGCCGTYDYHLHDDHRSFLRFAASQGKCLKVFIVADITVLKNKNRIPYFSQGVRSYNVGHVLNVLGIQGNAICLNGDNQKDIEIIHKENCDLWVFGPDQRLPFDDFLATMFRYVRDTKPRRSNITTTALLNEIGYLS